MSRWPSLSKMTPWRGDVDFIDVFDLEKSKQSLNLCFIDARRLNQ